MITTLIPYLLLANVSNPNWEHGPEFVFSLDVIFKTQGLDPELYVGTNMTNELVCRPKEVDTLRCVLRLLEIHVYDQNSNTIELIRTSNYHDRYANHTNSQDTGHNSNPKDLPFEMKFNKNGISGITLNENGTNDQRLKVINSIANLFNTGIDLSTQNIVETDPNKYDDEVTPELDINFLNGKCRSHIGVGFRKFEGEGNDNLTPFQLDLVDPIPQLSGRMFYLNKIAFSPQCSFSFLWSSMTIKHLENDPNLQLITLRDALVIRSGEFRHKLRLVMETNKNGHPINITETHALQLQEIKAAEGKLEEVKNPTTVTVI